LAPYTKQNGGVLEVERVNFVEGRGNLIIKYPGTTSGVCSFVGSHLDVVPADPKGWKRDPFKLAIEGDLLYGRGTTDCLGHCAVLTDLMISLAERRPVLKRSVVVVLIANEENGKLLGIGVEQLAKEGYLEDLKNGPLFWVDAADSQPCLGTAGTIQWELKVIGKLFHSGLPHNGINSIEFGSDALSYIQKVFYEKFPFHPSEKVYNFLTQSTMKATQICCAAGGLNQLPPDCTIQGDIRLTPFYDMKDVVKVIEDTVATVNANQSIVENSVTRGPHSKYSLSGDVEHGRIELKWLSEGENGVACKIESAGYKAIYDATEKVLGAAKPFAISGSLPLIRDLQDHGFDVQICGYGLSSGYHADNECAKLSDLKNATRIMSEVINSLETSV